MVIYDRGAEQAVIGAVLIAPDAIHGLAGLVPEAFGEIRHRWIWAAIRQVVDRSAFVDLLTVGHELASRGQLDEAGGHAYLAELIALTPTSAHAETYARIVAGNWTRRRLAATAADIAQMATGNLDPDQAVADAIRALSELAPASTGHSADESIADKAQQMYEWAKDPRRLIGVTSGIDELDRYTSGLRPVLHGIGARPDMGKTSLMSQCVMGQIRAGLHVYVAALEDGAGEVASRMALQHIEEPKEALRRPEALERYMRVMADIRDTPHITWHDGEATAEAIALGVAKAATRRAVDCIWVDHLGYMRHAREQGASISYRIGLTTKALQRLSVEARAPVMMFVQLRREGADGNPPDLTDFRESGEIEQDIRIGWMLHRPGYYSDQPPAPHILQPYQIWVRKAKDMATGPINFLWRASCARTYPKGV